MMRLLVLGLALAFAAAASAQLYRWVDKDGKVRYTDTPPPAGVKARAIGAPPAAPAPEQTEAPAAAAKDAAPKGPLTPAEQEQAFRKRQMDAQKAAQKADAARKDEAAKQQNCERARDYLRMLESGQRVSRTNAQGEREYLEDAAREREIASARQDARDWCG